MKNRSALQEVVRGVFAGVAACVVILVGGNALVGIASGVLLYVLSLFIVKGGKKDVDISLGDERSEQYWMAHLMEMGSRYMEEIERLSKEIRHEEIRAKADRCSAICAKILSASKAKSGNKNSAAKFLRYYLPMLHKILSNYVQLEQADVLTDQFIESVGSGLDVIEEAMKKQHKNLYESDLMAMSVDMDVLQAMVKKDGLLQSDFTMRKTPADKPAKEGE